LADFGVGGAEENVDFFVVLIADNCPKKLEKIRFLWNYSSCLPVCIQRVRQG